MSRPAVTNPNPLEDAPETTTTTVGESKPLHRFIKGEPKAIGIVLLILGSSQFILSIPLKLNRLGTSARLLTGFWMGGLLMVCGLLFVLAEIRPSKKLSCSLAAVSMYRDAVTDPSPPESLTETNSTTVGKSKPLHRFIRGQPKAVGIVLLILGSSQFILSIPLKLNHIRSSAFQMTGFWMGTLLMVCGLLFVLAENRPSKKLVTVSLALSVMAVLGIFPATIQHAEVTSFHYFYDYYDIHHELNMTLDLFQQTKNMVISLEVVFMVHTLVGGVLLIVMSFFAKAALRSTHTRATVVMTTLPKE